jgi:hypothetical protein
MFLETVAPASPSPENGQNDFLRLKGSFDKITFTDFSRKFCKIVLRVLF